MSLLDEVNAEAAEAQARAHKSKIVTFLDTLPPDDRNEFDAWLKNPIDVNAMWRVLKRRGLDAAEPTFRGWVARTCP